MSDFLTYEYVFPIGQSNANATSLGTVNYRNDGSFEIINIKGELFSNGTIIYGEDSGISNTLVNFDLSTRVESGIPWDTEFYLVNDAGSVIVEDDFFTGKRSQNYQQKDIIVAINIPIEPTPIDALNTEYVVLDGSGEYVVLTSWFDAGANTSNVELDKYLVYSQLDELV